MKWIKGNTLKATYRRQAIKWSLISLCLTVAVALPAFVYLTKVASENQVKTLAQSAAMAFRPMILEGDVRGAQTQMMDALHLKSSDRVVLRDKNLEVIYFDGTKYPNPQCTSSDSVCWHDQFSKVERLEPIYFDVDQKSLFGYVDLTIDPVFDRTWLLAFLFLIPIIFAIQSLGLISALDAGADTIVKTHKQWGQQIRSLSLSPKQALAPFQEFSDIQVAIDGLHNQILTLQEKVASETKTQAQLAIIREIGHDLKTPLSQLAKYWALHLDTVRTKNKVDEGEVKNVERILKRMGGIIRQIRSSYRFETSSEPNVLSSISTLTATTLSDLKVVFSVSDERILFTQSECTLPPAQISPTEYYQILENLVRNSLDAIDPESGTIVIRLTAEDGQPVLTVTDNGTGISPLNMPQIFDFEFTTKPAKGTGLGLGIVMRICKDNGAEIFCTSEPNAGTEFRIKFQAFNQKDAPNEAQNLSC